MMHTWTKKLPPELVKQARHFGRIRTRVLNQHNICFSTKLKVYSVVDLTALLYGCETWTLYHRQIKQLEKFHMCALHSILRICWQDHITNLEVLEYANFTSIKVMLLKAQLCWVGYVNRMDSNHIPRHLLYGELTTGKRNQCCPRKQFKENI